jgi:hypothetical protein
MKAFALDANNDIHFDELGRLATVSDAELTAQRIRTRLRWHRGEWAQDLTRGVDYIGQVFVKKPALE